MVRLVGVVAACAVLAGCGAGTSGSGSGGPEDRGTQQRTPPQPPVVQDAFTFWSTAQGLSAHVWDVSADEGGNVYVAGGDAVYAKKRGDATFLRFDPAAIGLTRNCDEKGTAACPVISVAGAAPGVAVVGLKGVGTDGDYDPPWQLSSGGADVLAFDGAKLTRTRHVEIAGVPHQMCDGDKPQPCDPWDPIYVYGRHKARQVLRIAVNHDRSKIQYGDVWFASTHATFSLLVANPAQRGWNDLTPQFPGTQDRQYVWEHDHPAMWAPATINGVKQNAFLTGDGAAIAIDPTTGDPWAANETRMATKKGYGAIKDGWWVSMWPPPSSDPNREVRSYLDVWLDPDPPDLWTSYDALDPAYADFVSSLSFCDDGTLWIASSYHGLARRDPSGNLSYLDLPPGHGNNASAVACDPSDGSVWVGFGWGGFGRYDGRWWTVPATAPAFAQQSPVSNIQIDRWASPRIVYFSFTDSKFGPGGVAAYSGN
jgi:hypothetical protein